MLETECIECKGIGSITKECMVAVGVKRIKQMKQVFYNTCTVCGGIGFIPTQLGQQILDFITRHHPSVRKLDELADNVRYLEEKCRV